MPYYFNPHRHVKIWLSKESDSFLNLENQIRLVKMRHTNPKDEIYFVYDKNLLSKKAFLELQSFCSRYKIIPKDLRQDIFPHCESEGELNLIEIYTDEISHLEEGGNLGVASDVLRWLKPIYELGTYADFDVHIDTSALPAVILVEKPLLLSLASFALINEVESILINNDTIAVVDSENALSFIQKIQEYIYRCCSKQGLTEVNFIQEYKNHFFRTLSQLTSPNHAESSFNQDANGLILIKTAPLIQGKTARQARKSIIDFTETNLIYSRKTLMEFKEISGGLSDDEIISRAAVLLRQAPSNPHAVIQDDVEFLTVMRQKTRLVFLKNIIMNISGPLALIASLFGSVFNKKDIINEEIRPFSFSCYGIDGAFVGQNSFAFHEHIEAIKSKFLDTTIGKHNDLSWLEEGQHATKERENNIRHIQLRIPEIINETHIAIKQHMKVIQAKQNGCFGFYQRKTRIPTINALDGYFGFYQYIANKAQLHVLACVLEHFDAHSFDLGIFDVFFPEDITSSIDNSDTKKLIEKLFFFGREARDYMLIDKHGKVNLQC